MIFTLREHVLELWPYFLQVLQTTVDLGTLPSTALPWIKSFIYIDVDTYITSQAYFKYLVCRRKDH